MGRDRRAAPPLVEVCVPRAMDARQLLMHHNYRNTCAEDLRGAGWRLPGVSNRLRKPRFHAVNSPQVRAAGPWAGKLRAGGLG